MRYHQIPTVLAIVGLLALLAVASPTGNALVSPRKKDDPYVNICSSFNFEPCAKVAVLGYEFCKEVAKDRIDLEGGVSSIQLHRASCQFLPTVDCNHDLEESFKYGQGGYVELPVGVNVPDSFGTSVFKEVQTSICNLWEDTKLGGIDHWDNHIKAYSCQVVDPWQPQEQRCG